MSVTPCSVAADYVERNAEALVASWIDWVRERVPTRGGTARPERALRNHIPPVLLSLSRYLRDPVELARQELLGHLRLHGQIRRDQGYSLQAVLAEFDGLADLVTRGVNRVLEEHVPDPTPQEMLDVATRLARGLRSVSFIAVGTYNESDEQRAHAISTSLEEFARTITHEPTCSRLQPRGARGRVRIDSRRAGHRIRTRTIDLAAMGVDPAPG
jgi:hypothetical protein